MISRYEPWPLDQSSKRNVEYEWSFIQIFFFLSQEGIVVSEARDKRLRLGGICKGCS